MPYMTTAKDATRNSTRKWIWKRKMKVLHQLRVKLVMVMKAN